MQLSVGTYDKTAEIRVRTEMAGARLGRMRRQAVVCACNLNSSTLSEFVFRSLRVARV